MVGPVQETGRVPMRRERTLPCCVPRRGTGTPGTGARLIRRIGTSSWYRTNYNKHMYLIVIRKFFFNP